MEEFKNLKEIIELCKEELENNDENVHATLDLEDLKELQNLINKYEELQKESFEDYKSYFDLVQEDNELLVQKENKIKELEKERDGIYADYQDLGKEKLKLEEKCEELKKNYKKLLESAEILKEASEEQEKIIELMAEYISGTDIDEDVCKKVGKNPFCDEFGEKSECEECVIEFFRKKAKGE